MRVDFSQGLTNATSPEAKYVARLAYMSCVSMGHAEFFSILHNNRTLTGNQKGLRIGLDDELITYAAILGPEE